MTMTRPLFLAIGARTLTRSIPPGTGHRRDSLLAKQ